MKKTDKVIIILVAVLIMLFITSKSLSRLESNVTGAATVPLAKWNILINNNELTSLSSADIRINNITWTGTTHASAGTVAPGSAGTINLVVDPTNTEVAFKYTISDIDKSIDDSYILTITDIRDSNGSLVKTSAYSYTGVFTLAEIKNGDTKTIEIDVEWINDESNNQSDTLVGTQSTTPNYIHLDMEAIQYNGETITPYQGG